MKRHFLLLLTLCFAAQLSAQQFDFTVDRTQGCTPLSITFTNTTDPAIIANYSYAWTVEPGKFSTEMYKVENSYLTPGTYTAQMKVLNKTTNAVVETISKSIQAFKDPDVQITSDKTESCIYKPFQFSITKKTSDAPIESYKWIVSDGTAYYTETPPAHYFSRAGTYDVICRVTDANGCISREQHTISVKTYDDAPKTSFTIDKSQTCDPSLQVQFTNTSPTDPLLARFEWNFGDSSPVNSTEKSPSHRYNGYGIYYASLKNISTHDCERMSSVAIQLIDYKADFTIMDASKLIDGNKACHGAITFVDNSQPVNSTISYKWDYLADGTVESTARTYSLQEATGGQKKMKLTVNNGVCERTITKTFEVETPLQISYTPTDEFYCKPTNVRYSAVSNVSGSTFDWVINGVEMHGQPVNYYFADEGIYSDALLVTTPNGCTERISKPNNIELVFPRISLSVLTAESGCVPLDVTFGETVSYPTERDSVVKVEWDFDYKSNFTTDFTGFDEASHTYTERGVYIPAVKATTAKGCEIYDIPGLLSDNYKVKAGNTPSADLIFPDTVVCASKALEFKYKNGDDVNSPMDTKYDTLFITFPHWYENMYPEPNGLFTKPAALRSPEPSSYLRDSVGEHNVFYILSDHGCRADTVQDFDLAANKFTTIHVRGPIIEAQASPKNCDDNYNYTYHLSKKINVDYSSPNQYVEWYLRKIKNPMPPEMLVARNKDTIHINFKDVYSYFGEPDGRGDYEIFVKAYNGDEECSSGSLCNCYDSVSVFTRITDIKADFTVKNPTPCLHYSDFVRVGKNAQDIAWAAWVKNGEQVGIDSMFVFDDKNMRYIEVVAADEFGCSATMNIPVKVYKPEAKFIADITSDCLPFYPKFSDITSWITDTTIVSREWDFGDGVSGTDSVHILSILYNQEQFVSPSLTVCDTLGCCDTVVVRNYIKPIVPNSDFVVTTPKLCLNHEAIITRNFSNPLYDNNIHKFTWDFGDGTTISGDEANPKPEYINADTVRHRYTRESVPGVFNISLTAYSKSPVDGRDCPKKITHPIEVKDVSSQIMISDMDKCKEPGTPEQPGKFVVFIDKYWYSGKYDKTKWYKIENGIEEPKDSTKVPDVIYFEEYGKQSIKLVTTSNYHGCELSTKIQEIDVPGYDVEFEADKYLVCIGEDVTFTRTKEVNVDSYDSYWSFGDGVFNYTDLEQAAHAYSVLPNTENERFKVQYIVDAPGCKPRDIFQLIELHPVEANFLRGINDLDSIGCAPNTVNFINTSIGVKNNVYHWNFGDGTTSSEKNPTHTFTHKKESYEVSLAIEGVACNDERMKKVYFYPKPDVVFDYDSTLCVGESVTINAQGDFSSIAWMPPQYFSNPISAITQYKPWQTGWAHVDVVSPYGCLEHDSLFVFVQQRPRYLGAPDSALLYYRTPNEIVLAARPDSKLIAGEIYNVNNIPIEGVFYEWSPSDYLSCTNCASPNIHLECGSPGYPSCLDFPLDIQYVIRMYDALGCFDEHALIKFLITVETKASLPQAFTPNGDGNNDIAFVRGWGIQEFLEVKIYNRWGQLLFESNDLNHGWNGIYNGEDQPMETYSYTIRYIDTKNEEQFVKGYITLIR